MNYRHSFHAGNFADVVKHIILARVIVYMQRKEQGFLYLDTHAGIGRFDLKSDEAERTGEWKAGIGRLINEFDQAPAPAKTLIDPYVSVLRRMNDGGDMRHYPGSPRLVHGLRRRQDRLSLLELHDLDAAQLKSEFTGASGVKVHHIDGWQGLKSQLPPKERRAVVLIDPPYEETGELDNIVSGIEAALKRFATGTYCIWYPIKNQGLVDSLRVDIGQLVPGGLLDCELVVRRPQRNQMPSLDGTGMLVINPPYVLQDELETLLPWLTKCLEDQADAGSWSVRANQKSSS